MRVLPLLSRVQAWRLLTAGLLLAAAAVAGAAWYGYRELVVLTQEVAELRAELASTTVAFTADIAKTDLALRATLEAEGQNVAAVKTQVATLEKLQALDPQLLAKYSKVYFLNENYMPAALAALPGEYAYTEERPMQLLPSVLPYLTRMLEAAKKDDIPLYVFSAYRSFDTQAALKREYTITFGAGTAGAFSADQGYSEHQLGTAVDLITTGQGGELNQSFSKTDAYAWLVAHAHAYGFVLSYPPGNRYYVYEPWHWRFVGVKLATDLRSKGASFYDLDQRTIDTYLATLFD